MERVRSESIKQKGNRVAVSVYLGLILSGLYCPQTKSDLSGTGRNLGDRFAPAKPLYYTVILK
jgi:hypothetical protein